MNTCPVCAHDWHGGSTCREPIPVEVRGRQVMYFDENGTGPHYAFDVLNRAANDARTISAACACAGT